MMVSSSQSPIRERESTISGRSSMLTRSISCHNVYGAFFDNAEPIQSTTVFLILENVLVYPFMTDRNTFLRFKPQADLFRTPFFPEQSSDVVPDKATDTRTGFGMSPFLSQALSLFRAITTQTSIAGNFPANGRFVASQYHCYLSLVKSCFQQGRNLVSFVMGKLLLTHCAPLTLIKFER